MPTPLPKFSGACARCPKCLATATGAAYMTTGTCSHRGDGESVIIDTVGGTPNPRMHRTCRNCGYQWDEQAADADEMPLEDRYALAMTALEEELVNLWNDYHQAAGRSLARPGLLSIEQETLRARIGMLTHIVGPADPEKLQTPLLLDGTYDKVHEHIGVEPLPWDRDEMQKWWDDYQARQRETVTPLRR